MEPRGATASYDAATDSYHLRVCSQGARAMRDSMAGVLKIGNDKIRVITEEVGGAFGLKTGPYPEYVAICAAAKKIGRPVHWMSGRSEAFLTDNHARDAYSEVELALDDKGRFLALRIRHIGNMGAYIGAVGANIQTINMMRCLPGMYDIKLVDAQTRCVFTNTVVTAPYRGAGRPEASYCIERVVDEAARITGIDPIRLRKRNLIPRKAMPYKTAVGTTYDSGDFAAVIDQGLELADIDGFKARKKEAKKKGLLRGIGVCFVLEHSGGAPIEGLMMNFPGRQHAGSHPQRAEHRSGTRHDLPAPRRRAAWHSDAADQAPPRRQPPRGRRLCLGGLPLGDDGRSFDGEDHRGRDRQGQESGRGRIGSR
jgi:carbon-monoxide dehydrogenase large subunit